MTAVLALDYMATADLEDGRPLPPLVDDDTALWRVVCQLPDARTRWLRIRLLASVASPAAGADDICTFTYINDPLPAKKDTSP
jgi:hypothetical protein